MSLNLVLRALTTTSSVFGENTGQQASEGERLLVAKAGANSVDPNVSSQIDFEGAAVLRKSGDAKALPPLVAELDGAVRERVERVLARTEPMDLLAASGLRPATQQ